MRQFLLSVWLRWLFLSQTYSHGHCDHSIAADDLSFLQTSRTSRDQASFEGQQHIYGKYLKDEGNDHDNSLYLFKPRGHTSSKFPLVVYFHGGGFLDDPSGSDNDWGSWMPAYVARGFAVAKINYRAVDRTYYYRNSSTGVVQIEELIHVAPSGKLWLDDLGRTMNDYSVRATELELAATKASYDAVQAIEYLIEHADELDIDCHQMVFRAVSAGNQPVRYLTWVYHEWNVGRFTPKGIIHDDAQISYPATGMLNQSWAVIASIVGTDFLLSDLIGQSDCDSIVGNGACVEGSTYFSPGLCNKTWHDLSVSQFCERPAFDSTTIADLVAAQVWPTESQAPCCDFSEGLQKLWYPSMSMQPHQFVTFYVMACNSANGTMSIDVAHLSMYAFQYAKEAQAANINYTAYYTDFSGMPDEAITEKLESPAKATIDIRSMIENFLLLGNSALNHGVSWNYLSSFDWRGKQQGKASQPCSYEESASYAAYAVAQA